MKFQQHALGLIALGFVLLGGWQYFHGRPEQLITAGIFSRVGFLLAAIWLAFPQLETLKNKMSMGVMIMVIGCLFVIAIRPKLVIIAVGLMVAGIFINGAMRRFASAKK